MPTYQIQRGDTLIVVARKNDVSVEDLMRVNGITAAEAFTIQPGQELLIPVEGSELPQVSAASSQHEPGAGEGLLRDALRADFRRPRLCGDCGNLRF